MSSRPNNTTMQDVRLMCDTFTSKYFELLHCKRSVGFFKGNMDIGDEKEILRTMSLMSTCSVQLYRHKFKRTKIEK